MKSAILKPILLLFLLFMARPTSAMELELSGTLERALKGDREAAYFLSTMYTTGNGAPRDCNEALKWGHTAAAQGHLFAQSQLGMLYLNGCGKTVPKNSVKAFIWLSLAADQGLQFASVNLADLRKTLHPYLLAEARRKADRFKNARGDSD